jgi:hypothetical protein
LTSGPDVSGSDIRFIGGAELAVVQRCRCATWENIMGKSAKMGTAKRAVRPTAAGNNKAGEKRLRQAANRRPLKPRMPWPERSGRTANWAR